MASDCAAWYISLKRMKDAIENGDVCVDDLTKRALNNSINNYNIECGGFIRISGVK